jgi:hypothetical protein
MDKQEIETHVVTDDELDRVTGGETASHAFVSGFLAAAPTEGYNSIAIYNPDFFRC